MKRGMRQASEKRKRQHIRPSQKKKECMQITRRKIRLLFKESFKYIVMFLVVKIHWPFSHLLFNHKVTCLLLISGWKDIKKGKAVRLWKILTGKPNGFKTTTDNRCTCFMIQMMFRKHNPWPSWKHKTFFLSKAINLSLLSHLIVSEILMITVQHGMLRGKSHRDR